MILNIFYRYQMINSTYHTNDSRSSFYFNAVVDLFQAQSLNGFFLALTSIDHALNLCYFDLCHDDYPLNTFPNSIPRCCATVTASRICDNADTVALTTL